MSLTEKELTRRNTTIPAITVANNQKRIAEKQKAEENK